MDYTEIPEWYEDVYYNKFKLEDKFRVAICRKDPTKFMYYMAGKTLRIYQSYLIDEALTNQYNAWCLPRQLGKTVDIVALAFWAAWFNIYSNKIVRRMSEGSQIYIMSRTEDQAKEVLLRIRELIRDADAHMSQLLRQKSKHITDFFSSQITEPDNVFQITFKNGSFIKCVPPTSAVRGKSADWFFIDEMAFLNNEDPERLYYQDIEPTVSQTWGTIIASSTPRGQQGIFYKIIDPYGHFDESKFHRTWFHYTIYDDPTHLALMAEKEREMRSKGEGKSFEQEYEAKFVSSTEAFFDSDKVDEVRDAKYSESEFRERECILGIDYGMVDSRSAIAISYYEPEDDKVITCYVKKFPSKHDPNELIPYIQGLMGRFNITKIVADDCPEGFALNKAMENRGWNIIPFNFTKEKTETYCAYRSWLHKGKAGVPQDKDLMIEMKGMQQEESKTGKLKIHKGGGLTDDMCDAIIMSVSQWVRQEMESMGLELV